MGTERPTLRSRHPSPHPAPHQVPGTALPFLLPARAPPPPQGVPVPGPAGWRSPDHARRGHWLPGEHPPALRPQGVMTGRRGGDAHVVQQTGEIRWCWIYGGFDLAKSVRNQINAINAYELPISSELSCSTGGCGEGRQLWGGGWQLSPLCTAACMPHARSPPAAAMLLEH